jgi:hypothetical protein
VLWRGYVLNHHLVGFVVTSSLCVISDLCACCFGQRCRMCREFVSRCRYMPRIRSCAAGSCQLHARGRWSH